MTHIEMRVTSSPNTLKFLLVSFNVLFLFSGIILLAIGIYSKSYFPGQPFLDDRYSLLADYLIVTSGLIFLVVLMGCYGVIQENVCMTLMFSTFLILILFMEVAAGIGGYILNETTEFYVYSTLSNSISSYNYLDNVTEAWDKLQIEFHCCGIDTAFDWLNSSFQYIPKSCLKPSGHIYDNGCLQVFSDYITRHISSIEVIGIVMGILQTIGIFLSCFLSSVIRRGYTLV